MEGNANAALTDEQRRLLELLGDGGPVAEAARRVGLSTRTAERRLAHARELLGAMTNAQAVSTLYGGRPVANNGSLTPRQREVLALVADGFRDDEIAERLSIARSTVAALIRSATVALGVRTRTQAAAKLAEKT